MRYLNDLNCNCLGSGWWVGSSRTCFVQYTILKLASMVIDFWQFFFQNCQDFCNVDVELRDRYRKAIFAGGSSRKNRHRIIDQLMVPSFNIEIAGSFHLHLCVHQNSDQARHEASGENSPLKMRRNGRLSDLFEGLRGTEVFIAQ